MASVHQKLYRPKADMLRGHENHKVRRSRKLRCRGDQEGRGSAKADKQRVHEGRGVGQTRRLRCSQGRIGRRLTCGEATRAVGLVDAEASTQKTL